jgi:phage anti-repressor protein
MLRKKIWIAILCCAALGAFGASAYADDSDYDPPHFKIYGGPAYVAPMDDDTVTFDTVTDSIQAADEVGWNLGIEGRFGKWFGLELDYVNANENIDFGGSTIGDANFSPLTATFNIHVVHTKVVDFYLGPSYTYVDWGDIHLNAEGGQLTGGSEIGTDSANGWGVSLGIDIGWEHFFFTGGLKYLNVSLEPQGFSSVPVNPLVGRVGVGVRF